MDRAAMRQQLGKRTEESFERKDKGGGMFGNIFRKDVLFKEWICKSDDKNPHLIDIIPYTVGENPSDPKVRAGDTAYVAEYFAHSGIGANEDKVVCLNKTFSQPCPICEERKELADQFTYEDDRVKKLKPSRQCIYNVCVYDTAAEEEKGVQVWSVAHWFFERFIILQAKLPRGGGYIHFADPDVGKSIQFFRTGKENVTFAGHQFVNREYTIPDEILAAAYCLEDLVHVPTYDEVHKLYYYKDNKEAAAAEPAQEDKPGGLRHAGGAPPPGAPASAPAQAPPLAPSSAASTHEAAAKIACPANGTIGVDLHHLDQCNTCPKEFFNVCLVLADTAKGTGAGAPADGAAPSFRRRNQQQQA